MVGIALPRTSDHVPIKAEGNPGLGTGTQTTGQGVRFAFALAAWGERTIVEPGETLRVQRPEMFIGVVVSGLLDKRATDGARSLVVDTLGPGATFFLTPTSHGNQAPPPLNAVRRSVVSVLNREELLQAFAHLPALSMAVFAETVQRLGRLEDRLEEIALTSARTQLARLLLRLTAARGTPCVKGIPQQKMAGWLGVHRESLTLLLRQMREEGIVKVKRLHIEIVDLAALRQAADGGTGQWLDGTLPEPDPMLI